MPNRRITHYSRHHDFSYPRYSYLLRKLTTKPLFTRASRAEDSAKFAYLAIKARGPRRKVLMQRLRRGHIR